MGSSVSGQCGEVTSLPLSPPLVLLPPGNGWRSCELVSQHPKDSLNQLPWGGLCWSRSPSSLFRPEEGFQLRPKSGGGRGGSPTTPAAPTHTHLPLSLWPEVYAVQRGQACPLTKAVDLLGLPVGGCPEPDLGSEALHVSFR